MPVRRGDHDEIAEAMVQNLANQMRVASFNHRWVVLLEDRSAI